MHQFQAIEAVKEWLHNHDRWLLIFDTAENAAAIFSVVPRRYGGAILVTTRSQEADPHCKSIVMEVMSQSEGVTFLLRRTSDKEQAEHLPPPERAALSQLWATMGGLPLALDQAGAYIRIARCSFHEYLDLFRRHRKDLLAERGAQTPEHPNAVATTWNLSFQRLERETPAAAELLRLCAFLAPDAIPEQLIVWGNSMERSSFSARRCPRRR